MKPRIRSMGESPEGVVVAMAVIGRSSAGPLVRLQVRSGNDNGFGTEETFDEPPKAVLEHVMAELLDLLGLSALAVARHMNAATAAPTEPLQHRILSILDGRGPVRSREILRATGATSRMLRVALSRLVRTGAVRRCGRGSYALPSPTGDNVPQ